MCSAIRGHGGRKAQCWPRWHGQLLLANLLWAAQLHAADTLPDEPVAVVSELAAPKRIVYGGDEDFPPYEFLDQNGRPAGFNVELILAVGRMQAISVEVRMLPWAKVRAGIDAGEIDVASMYRSTFRVKEVDFAIAHELVFHEMFIRVGDPPLRSLSDCQNKHVLVEAGTYSADALAAFGIESLLIPVKSEPTALLELANGKGDVAIVTQSVGRPFRKRMSLASRITSTGPPVLLAEYAFVTRKGRPHLLEQLNEGLNRVRSSGDYDTMYARWVRPDGSVRTVRIISWVLGLTLLLTFAIIVWNRTLRHRVRAHAAALHQEFEEKEHARRALGEAEQSLRNAQKMQAIGRLSGGVAHDFNNTLTVILNYGQFLRETLQSHKLPTDDVDQIISTAERAVRLTRQLLAFSRSTPMELVPIELGALVRGMKSLLESLVGAQVQIEIVALPRTIHVLAESSLLEQVLLNLAANARDAMPQGGKLVLEVGSKIVKTANEWHLSPGDYAALRVTDSGSGIDDATLGKIFDPFFTTKEPGKGTGLGLSTVMANVTRLGGRVTVESTSGKGTSFLLLIPEATEQAACLGDRRSEHLPIRLDEHVLVVEDDQALREAARYALERSGCTVIDAGDGEAAERIARENPRIGVIVSDVIMPKKTGPQLVAALRSERPGLRVLYVTGYVREGDELDLSQPGTAFLAKPYNATALVEAVARLVR